MLEGAGADLSRTVMSHLDRTVFSEEALLTLARRGCYLEYDLFGIETSHYPVHIYAEETLGSNLLCIIMYLSKGHQVR